MKYILTITYETQTCSEAQRRLQFKRQQRIGKLPKSAKDSALRRSDWARQWKVFRR